MEAQKGHCEFFLSHDHAIIEKTNKVLSRGHAIVKDEQ